MRIALASALLIDRDIESNLVQMDALMDQARGLGAELICFGETFLQGFNCFTWNFAEDSRIACSVHSAPFARIGRMSREKGIDVLFGFVERDGERLFSSCALVEKGVLTQTYRRISRGWKEYCHTDMHYCEGDAPSAFVYRGRRCAIALCGDLWDFPERFALGQELLFWPVYISYTPQQWAGGTAQEYALQTRQCGGRVLLCNSLCEGDSWGGAAVFAEGRIAAHLPVGQEGLLLYEV